MKEFEGKFSVLPETTRVEPRSCQELFKELEERRVKLPLDEWPIGSVLPVVGLEKSFEQSFYISNIS
ncbi:MAG: hypothetical protein ACPLY7_01885, partial [Microgenomates group bacterium]